MFINRAIFNVWLSLKQINPSILWYFNLASWTLWLPSILYLFNSNVTARSFKGIFFSVICAKFHCFLLFRKWACSPFWRDQRPVEGYPQKSSLWYDNLTKPSHLTTIATFSEYIPSCIASTQSFFSCSLFAFT